MTQLAHTPKKAVNFRVANPTPSSPLDRFTKAAVRQFIYDVVAMELESAKVDNHIDFAVGDRVWAVNDVYEKIGLPFVSRGRITAIYVKRPSNLQLFSNVGRVLNPDGSWCSRFEVTFKDGTSRVVNGTQILPREVTPPKDFIALDIAS